MFCKHKKVLAIFVMFLVFLCQISFGMTLSQGDKGEDVITLQNRLNEIGYSVGTPDGDFGNNTANALLQFQADHGLEQTGALDDSTYQLLFHEESQPLDQRYQYYIGNYSWDEADRYARSLGGHLININNSAEYNEVQMDLMELDCTDIVFWIGARRDRSYGNSNDFFWIDKRGACELDAIDVLSTFDEVNPWALEEPRFRDDMENVLMYVQLYYSLDEARWVWANSDGSAGQNDKNGFIIEFDEIPSSAVYAETQIQDYQPPVLLEAPQPFPLVNEVDNYEILYLGFERDNVVATLTTKTIPDDQACCIDLSFVDKDNNPLLRFGMMTPGKQLQETRRYSLFDEEIAALPDEFYLSAELYLIDWETGEYLETLTDWTDWYLCHKETSERINNPVAEDGSLWRVMPVLKSDPAHADPDVKVSILDANDNSIVYEGILKKSTFLPAGNYIAQLGENEAQTPFQITDSPLVVCLNDVENVTYTGLLLDEKKEEPLSGVNVTLEVQGMKKTTTTDATGQYLFEDIPPVTGIVSISDIKYDWTPKKVYTPAPDENGIIRPVERHLVAYFGHLHDEPDDWEKALREFEARASQGYYGSKEDHYWILGYQKYFIPEEGIPIHGVSSEEKIYNMGDEEQQEKVKITHEYIHLDLIKNITFAMNGYESELIVYAGYPQKNKLKSLNSHFDEWFDGWSDDSLNIVVADTPRRYYFTHLLFCIDQGKNAMEDDIFTAIMKRRYRESGMSDQQIDIVIDELKEVPEEYKIYRDLFLLNFYNYEIQVDSSSPTEFREDKVYIGNEKLAEFGEIFFHESGHAILKFDYTYLLSNEDDFMETIQDALVDDVKILLKYRLADNPSYDLNDEEIEQLVNAFVNGDRTDDVPSSLSSNKKLSKIYKQFKKDFSKELEAFGSSNASMPSDIIGGVTNNKLIGKGGHPIDDDNGVPYWYNSNGELTSHLLNEAWAEFYSAMIRNDVDNIENNWNYFPKGTYGYEQLTAQFYDLSYDYFNETFKEDEAKRLEIQAKAIAEAEAAAFASMEE